MFIVKLDGLIDTESAPCCCDKSVSDELKRSKWKTPTYVNDFYSRDNDSFVTPTYVNDFYSRENKSQHRKSKPSTTYDEAAEKIPVRSFGMDYESVRIPLITKVFYNEPYTIVKWSDGTTTKAAATENEPFNKEIGLSMAISKKVYESFGYVHPRAALKSAAHNAHDQTEKTRKRREYKARHKSE